ncbi:MAG: aldehyde dehydrogenase family protein [Acidobacteriota bacterium]|nr:aldehyde dehydrogenase family protein [Acidobacteriota bacterium]
MSRGQDFKITYSTLGSSAAAVHDGFEQAVAAALAALGGSHSLWIGGRERQGAGEFEVRSPVDRRLLVGRFQVAGRGEVAAAIAAAGDAFEDWRRVPWPERLAILRRGADRISARRFELAALMSLEVGKTRFEALADAEEAADLIRYYCQQLEEAAGFERPMGRLADNERTRDVLRPYGVWAVISPFNFPVALAAGMAAGALVGGNTVVLKPASAAPASALELYRLLVEGGLPDGVLNLVTGAGGPVGEEVVTNPGVAGIVFTGSRAVGFELHRRFNAARPRPCHLELGGKNAALVTARADLDKAVEGVARSAFGFGGQKCSACSRVYVDRSLAEPFRARLVARMGELAVGDPRDREVFLGPVIDEAAVARYERAIAAARRDGRLLAGGERLTDGDRAHGCYVTPALVDGLPDGHELVTEELFLPILCLREVDSLAAALELANASDYGLTAGIFSEEPAEVETFFDRIEAGVAYANRASGATTGAWPGVNPFCGWKASGSTGKGGCGPYYVQQFLREQSRTVME